MAKTIQYEGTSNVKKFRHFSRDDKRERRYPLLVAIDLLLYFGLTLAAIVLTVIALWMCLHAIFPGLPRVPIPRF